MLKTIGAVLIISAGIINGIKSANKLKNRVKGLRSIMLSVGRMRAELVSRLSSVTDILKSLSERAPMPAKKLYERAYSGLKQSEGESFYSIWRAAVDDSDELMLNSDEKTVLYEVGACLGKYDVKSQDELLNGIILRFSGLEGEAEDELKSELRLQAGLSVISCIFVVIILL